MATIAALKKQIAALQAKVERVAKEEMHTAIAKVHKLMGDFGITVEHLSSGLAGERAVPSKKAAGKKAAGKKVAANSKGGRPAKYVDPKSGATWSGLGRVPHWIAKAKNRDDFLIGKVAAPVVATPAVKAPSKKVAKPAPLAKTPAKTVVPAKKAAKSVMPAAKKAVAAKAPAKKAAVKKPAAKKSAAKKAGVPAAPALAAAPASA